MNDARATANLETNSSAAAFTLLDLLAVLAVCGLLVLLWVPARAGSRSRSQTVRCRDNLRQVMGAMLLYTHDNGDLFPPNPDDGTSLQGYTWCVGNVSGGLPGTSTGPYTFNPDVLSSAPKCLLAPYLQGDVSVFRCTADPRMGYYSGTDPSQAGRIVPAARTISMSCAVGTIDASYAAGGAHSGVPGSPVTGVWLAGSRTGNTHNHPYRTYGKLADMVVPAPASLVVLTEEDPFSINDGLFSVSLSSPEWVDFPSTLHNMGCMMAFGDGHAEFHKWHSASTRITGPASTTPVSPSDGDWNWLAGHISARAY